MKAGGALALAAGTAVLVALIVLIVALDGSSPPPHHHAPHRRSHRPPPRRPAAAAATVSLDALRMADTGAPSPVQCPLLDSVAAHHERAALLEKRAHQRGRTLTWAVHAQTPRPGGRVALRNADFASGTLRLRVPGVYELHEDVTFEPVPASPVRTPGGSGPYDDDAYVLGFFAALTVEAPDIVIDLRNHTLRQGRVHAAIHQRFFALIEVAAAPFITGQVRGAVPPLNPLLTHVHRARLISAPMNRAPMAW